MKVASRVGVSLHSLPEAVGDVLVDLGLWRLHRLLLSRFLLGLFSFTFLLLIYAFFYFFDFSIEVLDSCQYVAEIFSVQTFEFGGLEVLDFFFFVCLKPLEVALRCQKSILNITGNRVLSHFKNADPIFQGINQLSVVAK